MMAWTGSKCNATSGVTYEGMCKSKRMQLEQLSLPSQHPALAPLRRRAAPQSISKQRVGPIPIHPSLPGARMLVVRLLDQLIDARELNCRARNRLIHASVILFCLEPRASRESNRTQPAPISRGARHGTAWAKGVDKGRTRNTLTCRRSS